MSKSTVEATGTFTLPEKKVRVMPILRKGGWLPDDHDGRFMYTNTSARYCVPINAKTRQLIDPLTPEEREYFERPGVLGMKEGDLSIYKKKGENFWHTFEVKLNKNGALLDLSDPAQYLQYKVLLSNSNKIAPSFETRFDRATRRFMLVDQEHEAKENVRKADLMQSVWMEFGAIKSDDNKLRHVLKQYSQKPVARSIKHEFLVTEVTKIIEQNPNRFIEIITDDKFDMKCFIEDAVDAGAIVKPKRNRYAYAGEVDDLYSLDQIIEDLDPKGVNQDKYLLIKKRIEESKI